MSEQITKFETKLYTPDFEYYLIKNQEQLEKLKSQYLKSNKDVKKRITEELYRLRRNIEEIEKIMENK